MSSPKASLLPFPANLPNRLPRNKRYLRLALYLVILVVAVIFLRPVFSGMWNNRSRIRNLQNKLAGTLPCTDLVSVYLFQELKSALNQQHDAMTSLQADLAENKRQLDSKNEELTQALDRLGEKPKEKYQVLRETQVFKLPDSSGSKDADDIDGVGVHKSKLPKPANKRKLRTDWKPAADDITPLSQWESLPSSSVWCEGTKRQDRYCLISFYLLN